MCWPWRGLTLEQSAGRECSRCSAQRPIDFLTHLLRRQVKSHFHLSSLHSRLSIIFNIHQQWYHHHSQTKTTNCRGKRHHTHHFLAPTSQTAITTPHLLPLRPNSAGSFPGFCISRLFSLTRRVMSGILRGQVMRVWMHWVYHMCRNSLRSIHI